MKKLLILGLVGILTSNGCLFSMEKGAVKSSNTNPLVASNNIMNSDTKKVVSKNTNEVVSEEIQENLHNYARTILRQHQSFTKNCPEWYLYFNEGKEAAVNCLFGRCLECAPLLNHYDIINLLQSKDEQVKKIVKEIMNAEVVNYVSD